MARIKTDLADKVFHEILKRMYHYHYAAGDVVSEVVLAEEMGISRTPVREAILRLLDMGVLERTATRVVVRQLSENDIEEILQVREAIEMMAAKIIVARGGMTEEELAKLDSINATLGDRVSYGDFEGNFQQDFLFHQFLVECSQNSRLMDICQRLNIQAHRFRFATILTPERYGSTLDEHLEIARGFHVNNLDRINDAICRHIDKTRKNYEEILKGTRWSRMLQEFKNLLQT